jgi:ribosomal protein L11 methyltransferase
MARRRATPLETVAVTVPEDALEAFEAALNSVCDTVGFFRDVATGDWRVEGVKPVNTKEAELNAALMLAELVSGVSVPLERSSTEAEGWLARTYASFPEQPIGKRFAVRGTHLTDKPASGRVTLTLDAGLAFGSGEHGSTRGCIVALETVARRRPRRILDLGTGSGILAIAAAKMLRRKVLASDIEPWSVLVTRRNALQNNVGAMIRVKLANGWHHPAISGGGPYDLVFGNILARPLCGMAWDLSVHLAPGGTAILAGLLGTQVRMVLAAHRRRGLVLERVLPQGPWSTLVIRRRG